MDKSLKYHYIKMRNSGFVAILISKLKWQDTQIIPDKHLKFGKISRHEFWSIVLCEGASENSKPSQISAKTNI